MGDIQAREKAADEVFCSSCGAIIRKEAEICPKCGVRQKPPPSGAELNTDWLILLLLSFFVGSLGVDRFYVGKIGTGILKLITCGGFGIWWLIDLILIICERFTDANGNLIMQKRQTKYF